VIDYEYDSSPEEQLDDWKELPAMLIDADLEDFPFEEMDAIA